MSNRLKVHSEFSDKRVIGQTGLYAPQPIPAQIVLGNAKQFTAQRLLLALSSYLGDMSDKTVFPSYIQLKKRCGMNAGTISKSLNILLAYEFIKIFKYWENGRKRNKYIFQDACWHSYKMNSLARSFLPDVGLCICGTAVKAREITFGVSDYHHFNCGAVVSILPQSTRYIEQLSKLRAKTLQLARDANSLPEE